MRKVKIWDLVFWVIVIALIALGIYALVRG